MISFGFDLIDYHYFESIQTMEKKIKLLDQLKERQTNYENKLQDLHKQIKQIEEQIEKQKKNESITKQQIVDLFINNIKGKKYSQHQKNHDGSEGHWIEKLMNLEQNSNNQPDIGGYEMKKNSSKITFGDWAADEYLFSENHTMIDQINNNSITISKRQFMEQFGNYNTEKDRYSWSGSCVPKYGKWNKCGQILRIDEQQNILAIYSYKKDKRNKLIQYSNDTEICIAFWSKTKMENHVNNKFNQKGFFICMKNRHGIYDKICFGSPITYELFIEKIISGDIFFDSGMHYDEKKPNNRYYSHWRANQKFWNDLLIEEY